MVFPAAALLQYIPLNTLLRNSYPVHRFALDFFATETQDPALGAPPDLAPDPPLIPILPAADPLFNTERIRRSLLLYAPPYFDGDHLAIRNATINAAAPLLPTIDGEPLHMRWAFVDPTIYSSRREIPAGGRRDTLEDQRLIWALKCPHRARRSPSPPATLQAVRLFVTPPYPPIYSFLVPLLLIYNYHMYLMPQ
ncbi:hypothetical protein B0H19DRAFT_1258769 [Mycena capillaripes]|nr:hypothetical protein B0H19DRAFT_1258769 [Mycena capillaripes]